MQPRLFSTDDIQVRMSSEGAVEVCFGASSVRLSLDAALDFQYELAGFLAEVEQKLEEVGEEFETKRASHSCSVLAFKHPHPFRKKLDS